MPVKFEGTIPATLRKAAETHADRVVEVTGKGILYPDMYDCAYRAGWKSSSDTMGAVHSDCGATVRELSSLIRNAIPCDCKDCIKTKG